MFYLSIFYKSRSKFIIECIRHYTIVIAREKQKERERKTIRKIDVGEVRG